MSLYDKRTVVSFHSIRGNICFSGNYPSMHQFSVQKRWMTRVHLLRTGSQKYPGLWWYFFFYRMKWSIWIQTDERNEHLWSEVRKRTEENEIICKYLHFGFLFCLLSHLLTWKRGRVSGFSRVFCLYIHIEGKGPWKMLFQVKKIKRYNVNQHRISLRTTRKHWWKMFSCLRDGVLFIPVFEKV